MRRGVRLAPAAVNVVARRKRGAAPCRGTASGHSGLWTLAGTVVPLGSREEEPELPQLAAAEPLPVEPVSTAFGSSGSTLSN